MEDLLLYFVLGPFYLVRDLLILIGFLEGDLDSVRMVVAALGTAFYAALVGRGV